jgi:hypothetical protein
MALEIGGPAPQGLISEYRLDILTNLNIAIFFLFSNTNSRCKYSSCDALLLMSESTLNNWRKIHGITRCSE